MAGPSAPQSGVLSIKAKAQRLLGYALAGGLPIAMASPPTVAINTTSTVTGGTTYGISHPAIQYLGTEPNFTRLGGQVLPGHENFNNNQLRVGNTMDVTFDTDATTFEIMALATADLYRLFINGQAVSLTPAAMGDTSYSGRYLKVTGAAAGPKRIRYESNSAPFGGINVPANFSVWKSDIDTLRGMIVTDSYGQQYGDGTFVALTAFAKQLGYRLGLADWFVTSDPGEGYLNPGGTSKITQANRIITDVIPYAPDYLMIWEGINDNAASAAAVQAAATANFAAILSALPNTILTVVGPQTAPGKITPQAISDAIKAAVVAQGANYTSGRILFVDAFAEGWQQNAGKTTAVSGVGNSNLYIGADGIHPPQPGHDYFTQRSANAAIRHFKLLAA